jgi:hypothetical protein
MYLAVFRVEHVLDSLTLPQERKVRRFTIYNGQLQ